MQAIRIAVTSAVLALATIGTAPALQAQEAYPARPVRLVVPFPPGGGTDGLSRQVAEKITAARGWTFVIDNKPGVGGNIGLDMVAKAKPDGYTIGMAQTANLAINPALYSKMPYDARKDFTPIALVASQPVLFVVRAESPYRTLADLVAAAKAKPGTVTMASAGNGTTGHLAGEFFARQAGIKIVHVPYKGFGPALNDLYGGQTDFLITSPQSGMTQVKAGKLRALAATSLQRMTVLPQVPTVAESGFPGFEAIDWKGLVGPAGMPPDVVAALNLEVEKALRLADTAEKFAAEGGAPMGGSPQRMAEFIRSEQARWGTVVRESGATLD